MKGRSGRLRGGRDRDAGWTRRQRGGREGDERGEDREAAGLPHGKRGAPTRRLWRAAAGLLPRGALGVVGTFFPLSFSSLLLNTKALHAAGCL